MRPITGAIVTVGAALGLGLVSIGYGVRYQAFTYLNERTHDPQFVAFSHSDTTLMVLVIALLITLCIGLALTFVGLGYHHHKRVHELQHVLGTGPPTMRTTTHASP
jgi:hypothetical protein